MLCPTNFGRFVPKADMCTVAKIEAAASKVDGPVLDKCVPQAGRANG